MKILFITSAYYPAIKFGGPIESIHLLIKALIRHGVDVKVITSNAGLENNTIKLNEWNDIEGVQVKYLKYYFYEHYTFTPGLIYQLIKEIKNYDLIYISPIWNFPSLAGALISKLFKIPYVLSPRGTLYKETFEMKSKWIKKIYYFLFGQFILKNANAIHFTTEDEKINVNNYLNLKTKSFTIANGIDLSIFKTHTNELPNILKNKKYILFLSRISKKKGLDILIPAFKKISNEFSELLLVIAGPDNEGYKKVVENLIIKEGVKDKIIFTGMVTGNEKVSIYKNAELFILPSYSENFGMVVTEAMACNLPVVISNKVGLCKEVEKYNAGIITEANTISLYEGIKKVLLSEELKSTIIKNAERLAKERYNINEIIRNMLIEFSILLNQNNKVDNQ